MTDLDNTRLDNPQPEPSRWRRRWQGFKEAVVVWRAPGTAGFIGTAGSWTVWYYSKVPCIAEAAMAGLCNPGVLASYITLPALTSCLGIGAGFATLTGGYNIVMLNKERQRADAAEERADAAEGRAIKAQERADQAVDEYREMHRRVIEEHLAERQEERRRAEEEHRQTQEARESERRRAEEGAPAGSRGARVGTAPGRGDSPGFARQSGGGTPAVAGGAPAVRRNAPGDDGRHRPARPAGEWQPRQRQRA